MAGKGKIVRGALESLLGPFRSAEEKEAMDAAQTFFGQKKMWSDMTSEEQELHVRARDIIDQYKDPKTDEEYAISKKLGDILATSYLENKPPVVFGSEGLRPPGALKDLLDDDILPAASKSALELPQSIFDLPSFKSVDAEFEKLFPSREESFGFGTDSLLTEMSDFSEKYFLSPMTSGDLSKLLKQGGGDIDPLTPIIKELEEKGLSKSEMAEYLFKNDAYDPSEEARKVLGLGD